MRLRVAVFSLNQWALDFRGNKERIETSIRMALHERASYRVGPELELSGYSLEDAFFESDTVYHCWTSLLDIIEANRNQDIILDIGMPIFNNALYNCRVVVYKGKILCIRAKTSLARECIYRENRHFTPWDIKAGVVAYRLPSFVRNILLQEYAPFGANFILELDTSGSKESIRLGWDICQELWDPKNVSASLYQDFGCHLILNSSASYWELRKLNVVNEMIKGISLRGGACYAFSNLIGCDGQRYVFFGRSCIYDRGQLRCITSHMYKTFSEVEMAVYEVDAIDINVYRAQMGIHICETNKIQSSYNLKDILDERDFEFPKDCNRLYLTLDNVRMNRYKTTKNPVASLPKIEYQQEIRYYVSLWLWDYLRRSKMTGFVIPLSGGLDSSSVAMLVYDMCKSILPSHPDVMRYFGEVHYMDSTRILEDLNTPEKICRRLLSCYYISTRYSSDESLERALGLASLIGAKFERLNIQNTYNHFRKELVDGGCREDDPVSLLDQNLQARMRKDAVYYMSGGNKIVLGTGNVDEAIMGYFTKYDCSSADINPIGGLCKVDLRGYLEFCCQNSPPDLAETLIKILNAPPSAELTGADQRDEDEIGLTYHDISILGKVRRGIHHCSGPYGTFEFIWTRHRESPYDSLTCFEMIDILVPGQLAENLADAVKRFYSRYAANRHKLTVLTPALHAETYSPDDHRFDHRHFLYAPWTEQFAAIDRMVDEIRRTPRSTQPRDRDREREQSESVQSSNSLQVGVYCYTEQVVINQ